MRVVIAHLIVSAALVDATFSEAALSAAAMKRKSLTASHLAPRVSSSRPLAATTRIANPSNSSHKLYVFNTSNLIGGSKHTEILELDLSRGTMATAFTGIDSRYSFVSSSVICNGQLYAVATYAPMDAGILAVNLTSGSNVYASTMGPSNFLVHALACGAKPNELKMVVSEFTSPPTFTLRTYNLEDESSKVLGTFDGVQWGGWDTIFAFRGDEVWASFPKFRDPIKVETGELLVMDASTGALKSRKNYPSLGGAPYTTFAPKLDGTFNAIFHHPKGTLSFCVCDPSGSDIACSDCTDASDWWTAGDPLSECADGIVHVKPFAAASEMKQPVAVSDGVTAGLTHVFDILNTAHDYRTEEMNCFA